MAKLTRLPLMILLAACWLTYHQAAHSTPAVETDILEQAIAWRHVIHQNPELSNH